MSFRDELKVARCIGSKDFDGAIRIMTSGLTNSKDDVWSFEMIAQCHQWAGRADMAITFAKRALEFDPKFFGSFELLSRIYAEKAEHETAAQYARLGLENYPAPIPPMPRIVVRLFQSVFWALGIFIPRLRALANLDAPDPNKPNNEWYNWAKQYLEWYQETHGDPMNPTVH